MVLLKHTQNKRKFDPNSKDDLLVYKEFLRNNGWNGPCPFVLEWPHGSLPDMMAVKIAESVVANL